MISSPLIPAEPRFFFLMPVWGERYIEYLLTFGLSTLLAPNNLPWLPNRAVSQFTFLTRAEDEKHIRASKLFAKLEALIPVKFILLDFYEGDRQEKFDQLGNGLKHGASEALGLGYCLFFHPDGLYSDGMVKHLYGVARSGKKVCVTHGPNVALERIVPYLRERKLLTFDEINPLAPRVLARAILENSHPDTTIHCLGNPHYPVNPYMGFWLSPKLDGALFRFVSLHPWLVDLRHLSEIVDFGAIDHNFVRVHGYIWSDIHIETDSDNFLASSAKPENERNAVPNPNITHSPTTCLAQALYQPSNDEYSRFCFFHGLKVHTGDLDRDWHIFEAANLRWLTGSTNAVLATTIRNAANLAATSPSPLSSPMATSYQRNLVRFLRAEIFKYYWGLIVSARHKFFRYAVVEREPLKAMKYFFNILLKLLNMILQVISLPVRPLVAFLRTLNRQPSVTPQQIVTNSTSLPPEFCSVCKLDARRCMSEDRGSL